jgi:hypothetical protein
VVQTFCSQAHSISPSTPLGYLILMARSYTSQDCKSDVQCIERVRSEACANLRVWSLGQSALKCGESKLLKLPSCKALQLPARSSPLTAQAQLDVSHFTSVFSIASIHPLPSTTSSSTSILFCLSVMGGDAARTMPASKDYARLAAGPVGKQIHSIYQSRLRQFTDGGQYREQGLLPYVHS